MTADVSEKHASEAPATDAAGGDSRRKNKPGSERLTKKAFLLQLKQEYLLDLLRARAHGKHFRETRAQYISTRVRSISFILAVLVPAWIAIDALYLPEEQLQSIAILRLLTGGLCLLLSFSCNQGYSLLQARLRLALLVLIPSGFQVAASYYLLNSSLHALPAGYHFFPFLVMSITAIFPLTIIEGGCIAVFVIALELLKHFLSSTLFSVQALNDIWLLVLLALSAGWAALTQLAMLMRLYRQAHRDPLTGLANRRSIMTYLEREATYCRKNQQPLSVMLFDLDKFKRINDSHGHATGDEVLKNFADLMIRQSRQEDLVGRFGGEEFLMILSGTELEGAQRIAERLRLACHDQQVLTPTDISLSYTTSIGVAQLAPKETLEGLLHRVDEALYSAKGGGRDRVVVVSHAD